MTTPDAEVNPKQESTEGYRVTAVIGRPEFSTYIVCRGSFLRAIVAKPESPSIPRRRLARLYCKQSSAFALSVSNLPWCFAKKTAGEGFKFL
jgi:hypothetical protein